jgi:hypothetical protein
VPLLRKETAEVPLKPPGFHRHLEAQGLHQPHCGWCVHSANLNRWRVCTKYGAYVLIYSSCELFERRDALDSPIISEQEFRMAFGEGDDLRE